MSGLEQLRNCTEKRLAELRGAGVYRTLAPTPPDLIQLCSNDYLGLLQDEAWQRSLRRLNARAGTGASRLLGGEDPLFAEVERLFAAQKGAESSLLFPSGYAANEAVIQTLAGLDDIHFFSDELNHASIIDGFRVARVERSRRTVYRHGDVQALERGLRESKAGINVIATESVFSMDGDFAPLTQLRELAERYRGVLFVDEAHALGVFGATGMGLLEALGISAADVITVNTLGKALGLQGALVAGPGWFRELLINTARPFIYTTGPSPWLAEAALQTLREVPVWGERREYLAEQSKWLRHTLVGHGIDIGDSQSAIIPVIVGTPSRANRLADHLTSCGFFTRAIRPPTVPPHLCRVRLSLTAAIEPSDIQRLASAVIDGWKSS